MDEWRRELQWKREKRGEIEGRKELIILLFKRMDRLEALLRDYHKSRKNRIIIFVLYKKEAPRVEGLLKRRGWNAAAIHGDISQAQRTAAVEAFKAGTCPLLIATGE